MESNTGRVEGEGVSMPRRHGGRRMGSLSALEGVNGGMIHRLRVEKGWSGKDLAGEAGTSRALVSLVENGKKGISMMMLKRLAAALGVEPDSLLGDTSTMLSEAQVSSTLQSLIELRDSLQRATNRVSALIEQERAKERLGTE